jgi:hypothetical protein
MEELIIALSALEMFLWWDLLWNAATRWISIFIKSLFLFWKEINIEVFLTNTHAYWTDQLSWTLTHARTALNRSSSRQSLLLSRQSLFLSRLIALTEGKIALSLDFSHWISLALSLDSITLSHSHSIAGRIKAQSNELKSESRLTEP